MKQNKVKWHSKNKTEHGNAPNYSYTRVTAVIKKDVSPIAQLLHHHSDPHSQGSSYAMCPSTGEGSNFTASRASFYTAE